MDPIYTLVHGADLLRLHLIILIILLISFLGIVLIEAYDDCIFSWNYRLISIDDNLLAF